MAGLAASPLTAAVEAPLALRFLNLAECPIVAPEVVSSSAAWREGLSEPVRGADEKTVRIMGYMWPLVLSQGEVKEFLIMRNQNGCCYGQMPAVNEFIVATAKEPFPAAMDVPVEFEGKFRVAPVEMGGAWVEYFRLDDVKPVSRK